MSSWWTEVLGRRPMWMNGLLLFCAVMTFVWMPLDFFGTPVAIDEEAWFGIVLRGWEAKLTEPLHWAIMAAGTYGFWRMRPWMWPWAAVYTAQVALGTLIWSVSVVGGVGGALLGIACFVPLAALAWALFQARDQFNRPRPRMRERYGEWALITGASAGIGAEFARALAREGVSCVLSARREDRLRTLADELERTYHVSARAVAIDLAEPGGADALAEAVADLPIAVLVNNAGFGYAGRFDKLDAERLRAMVQVNCAAPVVLTRRLLPGMHARGCGAIVITGSVAGHQPLPLHGVYSATKAFDLFLGEALWAELRGSGVDVLVLEPGPTDTEFQAVAGEVAHPGESPAAVVAVALEALGRQPSVVSGWLNWMRANAARFLPRPVTALVAEQVIAAQTPLEMR
jgi:short-subunit dehydrogenase